MLIHLFRQVSVSSLDVTRKNSLPRSQILLVRGNNVIDGGESGSVNSVNEANRVFADATVSTRVELAGIQRGLYFLQLTSNATASTTLRIVIQ